jgi:2-oxoglutarate ferredoxin oxidoreductase subunit alpha
MKFNWKIGGEAGFGVMTTGVVISKIATRSGYHIFNYQEYPSLIRGGHNTVEVVISDEDVGAPQWGVDMLVCLNKDTYDFHKHRLHEKSIIIYDPEQFEIAEQIGIKIAVPFQGIRKTEKIQQQMVNTVAMGTSLAVMGADLSIFTDLLKEQFSRKGQEVIDFNLRLAKIGYDHVKQNNSPTVVVFAPKEDTHKRMVLTGNDAYSAALVAADCRYYAAYPMTPSSSILMTLADWQKDNKMVVRHSEDEIAVINSALGASFSGVRSSVGTSGGGFALMVEALSYAGVAEIPIVVYLGMRPGPATGMPTWTEQGDLLFAVNAGHGEFPKIVLAPGDPEEMIHLTLKAFDLADIYQTPVIVLADKFLGESYKDISHETVDQRFKEYIPNRGKIVHDTQQSPYLRYKVTEDGSSEMLIPGKQGVFYQANSYEHLEDSHTSEDSSVRIAQVDKRQRKITTYMATPSKYIDDPLWKDPHFAEPVLYGDPESTVVFVSWGGTKGIIREAQKLLERNFHQSTGFLHFTHVFPLNEALVKSFFKEDKRYILVENNSHGQFGQLLRMQTGIEIKEKLLKYDGRPFWPEEIVAYMTKSFEKLDDDQKNLIHKLQSSISDTASNS